MKRIILSLLAASCCLLAAAQGGPVVLDVWPDGAPNDSGLTGPEQPLENGRVANITRATLTVYPAAKPNGIAVIMCPGGGYRRLAMNHEGYDMAPWFNNLGITYAVLKYRMPNGLIEVQPFPGMTPPYTKYLVTFNYPTLVTSGSSVSSCQDSSLDSRLPLQRGSPSAGRSSTIVCSSSSWRWAKESSSRAEASIQLS